MRINLDNSAFSLLNCERKFQLRVVEGKTEPKGDGATFGDCVHKILEFLDKGNSVDDTVEKVHKLNLGADLPKALSLMTFFRSTQRLTEPIKLLDGSPAIEVKFSNRYGEFILPNSHELLEIYLQGTIDRMHIDNDELVILDYKTTAAATPYKLSDVCSSYALSFQLPFYFYNIVRSGMLPASIMDYITSRHYRMEILVMAHNMAPPTFKRVVRPAFNDDFISREVPLIINSRVERAIHIASMTSPAAHTGMTVYKACDNCGFRPACLSMGEAREDEILSRYEVKPYDPMTFR